MLGEQRLEEQVLAQEAKKRVSEQLDTAEKIDVDIQTDLLKIIQGKVDGVHFSGQGLIIKNIRVQEIILQSNKISVNPLSALFGEIELNEPIDVTARMVLTEADINQALISKYVRSNMQTFNLDVDGRTVSLKPQEIEIQLPGDGKIGFVGKVIIQDTRNIDTIGLTALFSPRKGDKPILMEKFYCKEGNGISFNVVLALLQKVKELINLPYLDFEDMALRVKEMEVEKGQISLLIDLRVKHVPSTG
jgi:LmeA-like phospholipid-binding